MIVKLTEQHLEFLSSKKETAQVGLSLHLSLVGNCMSRLKHQRISDSFNEGLPIKVARKMFQRKR